MTRIGRMNADERGSKAFAQGFIRVIRFALCKSAFNAPRSMPFASLPGDEASAAQEQHQFALCMVWFAARFASFLVAALAVHVPVLLVIDEIGL